MTDMQQYANKFWLRNRGYGVVTNVTDYSFTWEGLQDLKHPEKKVDKVEYYLSYFWKRGGENG